MAGKGCFDPDHTLEEYKENGWAWCPPLGNCLRARGVKDLFCNHCEKAPGSLYLRMLYSLNSQMINLIWFRLLFV